MPRQYSTEGGQSTAASATETQVRITAGSTVVVLIREVRVSQSTHKVSEQYKLVGDRCSAAGSGGASVTPRKMAAGSNAAASTSESGPTSEPTYSGTPFLTEHFNSLAGGRWRFEPPIEVAPSAIVAFNVQPPSGSTTCTPVVDVIFDEVG